MSAGKVKTILLTGATDGIGFETAKSLVAAGHKVLIHGRSADKLKNTKEILSQIAGAQECEEFRADLSVLSEVETMATAITAKIPHIDVVINNAGVFKLPNPRTTSGHDVRFLVNTVSPYLLTKRLLPFMNSDGRIINLSSAAQAPVNLHALRGEGGIHLTDGDAYAQSKLAITMWSAHMAKTLGDTGPAVIAVNPASFIGSKMVKEAYGVQGQDLRVGSDILVRAALSDEFADASGQYFDNDQGQFSSPHQDAMNANKNAKVVQAILDVIDPDMD